MILGTLSTTEMMSTYADPMSFTRTASKRVGDGNILIQNSFVAGCDYYKEGEASLSPIVTRSYSGRDIVTCRMVLEYTEEAT